MRADEPSAASVSRGSTGSTQRRGDVQADDLDPLHLHQPDGQERIESAGEEGEATHAVFVAT